MTHPAIEKLALEMYERSRARGETFVPFIQLPPHRQREWLEASETAHRIILSEPPSPSMVEAGALGADDDVHAAFAKSTYIAMNRARLRELGLEP